MGKIILGIVVGGILGAALGLLPGLVLFDLIPKDGRTALAGTDSVNWGTLAPTPPPSDINVANPFTILSTAGRSISDWTVLQAGPVITWNPHQGLHFRA